MRLIQNILKLQVDEVKANLNLPNMMFRYCTGGEFIQALKMIQKSEIKYPFFFIDSSTVVYGKDTVKVGKIIIAKNTVSTYTSEQREVKSFNDVLVPIVNEFIEEIWIDNRDLSVMKHGDIKLWYFYGNSGIYDVSGNVFEDAVDAIELKDFQFRISN